MAECKAHAVITSVLPRLAYSPPCFAVLSVSEPKAPLVGTEDAAAAAAAAVLLCIVYQLCCHRDQAVDAQGAES